MKAGNPKEWSKEGALRAIWKIANGLVEGIGPPEEFEKTDRQMGSFNNASIRVFGQGRLAISIEERKYLPASAMGIAGYILFGYDYELDFEKLGLTRGSVATDYLKLQEQFGEGVRLIGRNELGGVLTSNSRAKRQAIEGPTLPRRGGLLTVHVPPPPVPEPEQLQGPAPRTRLAAQARHAALPDPTN